MSWLFGLMMWTLSAHAGEFFLEGPVYEARGDAVATSRAARTAGHDARVVRRYKDGVGWEYVVRVGGFADQATAVEAVPAIAEVLGGSAALYRLDAPDAEPVQVRLGERSPTEDEPEQVVSAERLPSALEPTMAAHGGPNGGAAALEAADAVLFEFQRTLPDGKVIGHTWARQGTAVYAAIRKVEGDVTPSRTLITEAGAWLAAGDGELAPQDRERTSETLATLAPDAVVPFVLSFAALAEERNELKSIHEAGEGELDGTPVKLLQAEGDQASGPLVLQVERDSALLRRVDFNDGAMVVQFDGWGELQSGGLILPRHVRTWRDGSLVDTVEIRQIDLEPTLEKGWFEAP